MNWLPSIALWLVVLVACLALGASPLIAVCWTLACLCVVLTERKSRWATPALLVLVVATIAGLARP